MLRIIADPLSETAQTGLFFRAKQRRPSRIAGYRPARPPGLGTDRGQQARIFCVDVVPLTDQLS